MGWIQGGVKGEWGNVSWMSRTGNWRGIFNNSCPKGNWNLGRQPAQGLEFLRWGKFTELTFPSQVLPVCYFFLLTLSFFYNIIKKYLLLSQFFFLTFLFIYLFTLPCQVVWGILAPHPGIKPVPHAMEAWILFFIVIIFPLLAKTFNSLKIFYFIFNHP